MQSRSTQSNGASSSVAWLLFFSGAAALAHQTFWTRRLVDLLGASAHTFSQVVGAFFLGLALGGGWAALRSGGKPARWKQVAAAECAVGLLALPCLLSVHAVQWLPSVLSRWQIWKGALPILLILPAAFAMGLVLPWTLQALTQTDERRPVRTVWLYTVNTLGGIAGILLILLCGQFQVGLQWIGYLTLIANLAVAAGFLRLAARSARATPQTPVQRSQPVSGTQSGPKQRLAPLLLAWASGFLVLGLEVLVQHQFAQITINSFFSSAVVLILVLAGLALGGWALTRLNAARWPWERTLRHVLAISALACLTQPFLFLMLRPGLRNLPYEWPPSLYLAAVLGLGALVALPLFLSSGMLFPTLLREAAGTVRSEADARRHLALLLMLNGVGGWTGAETTVHGILPRFGLWQGVMILGIGYALLLIVVDAARMPSPHSNSPPSRGRAHARGAMAVILGVATLLWTAAGRLPQVSIGPNESLVALRVDREGVVASVQSGPDDHRILFNNAYTLGGSKAQYNQERQGLLPVLLHGRGGSAALLGVATGSTTAGTALSPSIQRLDAVELSARVLELARTQFAPFNRDVFQDPRARFIHEDARWVIASQSAAYDVVIGDLFLPWRTGEGRLFTQEHFQAVKSSLKPGGLYCQWLPLFQLTREQFMMIARTFATVFPEAFAVRGDFYTELPILGLVGGQSLQSLSWDKIALRCAELREQGRTHDPLLRHPEGVAMLCLGPLGSLEPGPVNTLANAALEWSASRNIIGLREPWFVGVPCAEFVKSLQTHGQALLPEALRGAQDSGQFFLTLEIAAKVKSPVLENLKAQTWERLPAALQQDRSADWERWPMRIKPHASTP